MFLIDLVLFWHRRGFKLHSILPSTSVSDALTMMRLTHMRALPIVDEAGTLISQISASDISHIFPVEVICFL